MPELAFKPDGGLGNILFMHHAAYSYAKDHNLNLCAVGDYPTPETRPPFSFYKKLFSHVKIVTGLTHPIWTDPILCHYTPIPVGAASLTGFYQSYKYFQKYQWEIRDLLRRNESDLWNEKVKKFKKISGEKSTVCVHIRRGDYLQPGIHRCIPEDYYTQSLSKFKEHKIIVFSDGLDEVKTWKIWKDQDVVFIEDEPGALETLFLMSLCNHFVIANSTLSLMAYYMREHINGTIIAPSSWFNTGGPSVNMADLIDKSI